MPTLPASDVQINGPKGERSAAPSDSVSQRRDEGGREGGCRNSAAADIWTTPLELEGGSGGGGEGQKKNCWSKRNHSDGHIRWREGRKEGKRNFLIERFRSRHCHAEQSRAERRQRGRGMEGKGRGRPSVRVGLIRHDRTRLGAPSSITRTRLGRPSEVGTRTPNSMVVVALKKGREEGKERHVH